MLVLSLNYPSHMHLPQVSPNISWKIPWEHVYEQELVKCQKIVWADDAVYIDQLLKHFKT